MASSDPTQQPPAGPTPASSSSSSSPTNTNTDPAAAEDAILHNVALGVTPIALGAMFLPPRRFDLRLVILGGVALWGTNQLALDYTGTSTFARMGGRLQSMAGTELPEKAQRTQMLMRQERERRAAAAADQARLDAAGRYSGGAGAGEGKKQGGGRGGVEEEEERKGSLEAIWMGDAEEDWKEKRARREREALQEGGGGIWGLIMDHISDVRNSGKQKRAEVLAAREEKHKQEEKQDQEKK
ncbi:uncharacterized protein B0I36DRAFT_382806 [Microdochium trichocladiopsis]|uniref:Rhomboid family membrane protein n=1 Tax=Microdochium trichocladiopsis TaxID=1682393 RepID=A0A9P9BP59_9PEZI|nr:uncharacterized protein B0I36DRAFT_382806 [Microdochium trichocladiopsis]KAH7032799.1 hypothetical protein B0I36DRAFT_382806 [Microdochium trichocladiopsis]